MLYYLGCCRIKLNSFATALALYSQALELVERSPVPDDRLRSHILEWRSRCYRQARDYQAAKEDVERALELAEGLNDRHTMAHVYFQYSLIAERTGNWVPGPLVRREGQGDLRGGPATRPTSGSS